MQIIHISEDRFNRIKSQGYQFKQMEYVVGDGPSGTSEMEMPGSCVYHFLPDEKAICPICDKELESIKAETPADLEILKYALSKLAAFAEIAKDKQGFDE